MWTTLIFIRNQQQKQVRTVPKPNMGQCHLLTSQCHHFFEGQLAAHSAAGYCLWKLLPWNMRKRNSVRSAPENFLSSVSILEHLPWEILIDGSMFSLVSSSPSHPPPPPPSFIPMLKQKSCILTVPDNGSPNLSSQLSLQKNLTASSASSSGAPLGFWCTTKKAGQSSEDRKLHTASLIKTLHFTWL